MIDETSGKNKRNTMLDDCYEWVERSEETYYSFSTTQILLLIEHGHGYGCDSVKIVRDSQGENVVLSEGVPFWQLESRDG